MQMRSVTMRTIKEMKQRGFKITLACLYEPDQCRDASEFVVVPDYPLGRTIMRIWPC